MAFWRGGSVFSFIIFLGDIIPISWQNSSTRSLETFHHGSSFVWIWIFEDLLEESHSRVNTKLLTMFQNITFNLSIYFIPVFFGFWTCWILNFLFLKSLWDAQSIFSQILPIFSTFQFFHNNFNRIKSMNSLWSWRNNFTKQLKIQMIMSTWLNGEINCNSLFLELYFKIIFILNSIWNFDTNLCWSLIPCICDFIILSNNFFFSNILFSKSNDVATRNSFQFWLLDSF